MAYIVHTVGEAIPMRLRSFLPAVAVFAPLSTLAALACLSTLAALASAGCAASPTDSPPLTLEDENKKAPKGGGDQTPRDPTPADPGQVTPPPHEAVIGGYAHSSDTLFGLDVVSKTATPIGKFSCVAADDQVLDLAVDGTGAVFATTGTSLVSVDPKSGSCTVIATRGFDQYPNSLSFVPAGTLDSAKETLVGYAYDDYLGLREAYVRIDVATGAITSVGYLNPIDAETNYESSGDLIGLSNDGNRAYLTVKPAQGGTDRLAEIDPKTGVIKRIIGDTGQTNLYGLAYWGGTAYGFSGGGGVFAIDIGSGAATAVTLAGATGIAWYGAGVTTKAPVTP